MRIVAGDTSGPEHVWDVPETRGREALALSRLAKRVIGELGIAGAVAASEGTSLADIPYRLAGHAQATELLRQTLRVGPKDGSTVDGLPVTAELLEEIEIDPDRSLEPWAVLLEVWVLSGFFGAGLRRAYQSMREATPTSDSTTTSSQPLPSPEPATAS